MIYAGKLDRKITIERATETVNEYGAASETWTPIATMRAERVQASVSEFARDYGLSPETAAIFRVRYLSGLGILDRLNEAGALYDIKELVEIGRRRGWEIRAVRRT